MRGILDRGEYQAIRGGVERVSPALAKIDLNRPDPGVSKPKAVKTAQALIRCVDDLHRDTPDASKHTNLLNKTKEVLEGLQGW